MKFEHTLHAGGGEVRLKTSIDLEAIFEKSLNQLGESPQNLYQFEAFLKNVSKVASRLEMILRWTLQNASLNTILRRFQAIIGSLDQTKRIPQALLT